MKSIILPVFLIFAFCCDAQSAVKVKNSTANRYEEQIEATEGDEAADIETLQNDIRILDEEIAKCKKQKKGWIAATVVGAAGTVATGVAAGIQGVKLKETESERDIISKELGKKQAELKKLELQKQELKNSSGN